MLPLNKHHEFLTVHDPVTVSEILVGHYDLLYNIIFDSTNNIYVPAQTISNVDSEIVGNLHDVGESTIDLIYSEVLIGQESFSISHFTFSYLVSYNIYGISSASIFPASVVCFL